jgi:hypothetical protein
MRYVRPVHEYSLFCRYQKMSSRMIDRFGRKTNIAMYMKLFIKFGGVTYYKIEHSPEVRNWVYLKVSSCYLSFSDFT